jgi:hypothetical protein
MSSGRQWSRCSRPRPRLIRWAVTGPYRSDPRPPGVRHHVARPSGRVDRRRGVRAGPHRSARGGFDRIIGLDLDDVPVDGSLHQAPYGGKGTGPNPPTGPSWAGSVRRRRPRPVRDPTPRHQGPGRQTSAVAARALDRRSHQHLAVQLRATSPQHRPASPPPPRRSVPRHHSPHRRPPHRLAQPLELHVSAYPLKFLAGQGRLSQSPTPGCPGSAWPGRRRPWCR